jgi:hypothetical protein
MRRILLALLSVLGAAVLGGGWYAYDKGFTKKWRGLVAAEFRKRGVEVELHRLKIHPLRGLIAEKVKVYDARDHLHTLAVVDEVRLVLNWANLSRGDAFIDALELHDATLSLPLDPANPGREKVRVSGLSGRLALMPHLLVVNRFEAELEGVRVQLSGRLVNPQVLWERVGGQQSPARPAETIAKILAELRAIESGRRAPPALDVRFSGDLARPETLLIEASGSAQEVARGPLRIEDLEFDAVYRDGRIALRQFEARDRKGTLRIAGSYDLDAKGLDLDVRSTLDLQPIAKLAGLFPQLQEVVFYEPPQLDFALQAAFGDSPDLRLLGRIAAGRFGLRSVVFERLSADIVFDGERWAARHLHLLHQTGELSGDVMHLPGDFRTRLRSTINPKALAPFLEGETSEWFKQFDFADSPSVSLELHGPEPDTEHLSGNAALRLGRTSYRNVWALSATATLRYADRKLTIDPLRVVRAEGSGEGGLVFDFARDEVAVQRIRTTLFPQEVVWWVDRKMAPNLAPYRFGSQPPSLSIAGLVHTKGGSTTGLRVEVDAPGGMDYTFLRRDLRFSQISARLAFSSSRMKIEQLSGQLLGGRLRGTADISLKRSDPLHHADLRIEDMDFARLTQLYFDYASSKGRLNARYGFSLRGSDARTMRGRGDLSVADGQVFAIPFLGPLSGILNSIVPGMGDDVARKGAASFLVDKGTIDTSDLVVEGSGFSMIGGGKLFFLDDGMNFDVRINARGLPGVLLFPVSKLFEYTATDALSKPHWRPKLVPRL